MNKWTSFTQVNQSVIHRMNLLTTPGSCHTSTAVKALDQLLS